MKHYDKIRKKYQKRLKKVAKTALPFDYGYGLDIFICFLEYMLEYYETQENVIGSLLDDLGIERDTRVDKIKEALNEYNLYLTVWDGVDLDIAVCPISIKGGSIVSAMGSSISYDKNQLDELVVKEQQHWNNFWNIIRDNIADWWD